MERYNPLQAPEPTIWLELGEAERKIRTTVVELLGFVELHTTSKKQPC